MVLTLDRRSFAKLAGASLLAAPLGACARPGGRRAGDVPAAVAPASFTNAVTTIRATIAREAADPALLPAGRPRLYHHGRPVRQAIVLLHGFTNCPQQFDELARAFHARGCNVYVPRIPHHGLRDRLTHDLELMTVAELQRFAAETFALAVNLGTAVTVLGISLGGTLALWLAQTQPVALVVPIAPFLIPLPNPQFLGGPALRLLRSVPSMYWWWDIRVKERGKPDYAYPGYPTHALAEMIVFGDAVTAAAAKDAPRAQRCIIALNEHDDAVDNRVTRALLATWKRHGARYGEVLSGVAEKRHDIIDPTTFPRARSFVYPRLESLVLAR